MYLTFRNGILHKNQVFMNISMLRNGTRNQMIPKTSDQYLRKVLMVDIGVGLTLPYEHDNWA